MNKYQAYVRIKGQLVNTVVFADNPIHARLILQYQFGMDSLASNPSVITKALKLERNRQKIKRAQQQISVASSKI